MSGTAENARFAGAVLAIGPTLGPGFRRLGILMAFCGGLSFAVYSSVRTRGRGAHDVVGLSMGMLGAQVASGKRG